MSFQWGYGSQNGPDKWSNICEVAEHPVHGQSPINIERKQARTARWHRLRLTYKSDQHLRLKNTGHTFVIEVPPPSDLSDKKNYSLRKGPLKEERYQLCQIHFHWGQNNSEGAEHTVDGRHYVSEAHFVHFNMKYSSFTEACDKYDGLTVLAVLFELGDANAGVQTLVDNFDKISHKGSSVDLKMQFSPSTILPAGSNRQCFWYYHGSLTTPPCYESVNWIVFQKTLQLSTKQLDAFRRLHSHCSDACPAPGDEHGGRILCNFRPTQPKDFKRIRERDGKEETVERPLWAFTRSTRPKYKKLKRNEDDSLSSSSSSDEDDEFKENNY